MRFWQILAAFALLAHFTLAKAEVSDDPLAFERDTALSIAAQDNVRLVLTDNVSGYFESYSREPLQGVGYRIKDQSLLQNVRAQVDGKWLEPAAAVSRTLQFYGIDSRYEGADTALLVHSGRQAISFRVQSSEAKQLAIEPLWPFPVAAPAGATVFQLAPAALAAKAGVPGHIAIVASGDVDLKKTASGFAFASRQPVKELSLHLVFADTAKAAGKIARELADTDPWTEQRALHFKRLNRNTLQTDDAGYNRALAWAEWSAYGFVVEEFGKGIWAGLPWFRDNWGRDTFIALPGTLLVNGHFEEARAVLDNFARHQNLASIEDPNYGRIPNRVAYRNSIIYNTVDGTPWMIREAWEYMNYSGDRDYGRKILPLIRAYVAGVERHWVDEHGLLTHDDADTWMDARIAGKEPWSARGNRAVEIQLLWHTALVIAEQLAREQGFAAEATHYRQRADRARNAFGNMFWDGRQLADRLRKDGSRDEKRRPNVLMAISIPFQPMIDEAIEAQLLRDTSEALLFPYGLASLDPQHPYFHPRHVNDAFHHKDAAYHNGTVWGWNAGFAITALNKFGYQDLSWQLSRNLSDQILNLDARGHMSELLDALPDASGKPVPSGTYAQSWSVAEFVRNAHQDYLGFRPELMQERLRFVPALPADWKTLNASLCYGREGRMDVQVEQKGGVQRWQLRTSEPLPLVFDLLALDGARQRIRLPASEQMRRLLWDGKQATLDGEIIRSEPVMASQRQRIGELAFARAPRDEEASFPVLKGKDQLQKIILDGKFQ